MKDMIPWARAPEPAGAKAADDNPFAALQRDLNQVFDSFRTRFGKGLGEIDWPWGTAEARSDVVQTDGAVEVSIELPGLEMKDIEVTVGDDTLTVRGEKRVERKEEKKGYYLSERSYGAVYRTIPLPPGVDGAKAEATFRNGVLTVRLPQTPEAQSRVRHVEVKAS